METTVSVVILSAKIEPQTAVVGETVLLSATVIEVESVSSYFETPCGVFPAGVV